MKLKTKHIACPHCGNIIGTYSEELEAQRKVDKFKSYCIGCSTVVTPLYI